MKKIFYISALLFFCINSFGQEIELGDYILVNSFVTEKIYKLKGDTLKTKKVTHKSGNTIEVLSIKGDTILFHYKKSKENYNNKFRAEKAKDFNLKYYGDESKNELHHFIIQKKEFLMVAKKYNYYPLYKGAIAGIYSVPFKLRFNSFDFEQNLNLGLIVGLQFRLNKKLDDKWIIEPSAGIGLTRVNLNNKNSDVEESRTANAVSISLGTLLKLSEKINIGVFLGKDYLGRTDSEVNWRYNGKTWLGLGINVGFGTSKSEQNKSDPVNTISKK